MIHTYIGIDIQSRSICPYMGPDPGQNLVLGLPGPGLDPAPYKDIWFLLYVYIYIMSLSRSCTLVFFFVFLFCMLFCCLICGSTISCGFGHCFAHICVFPLDDYICVPARALDLESRFMTQAQFTNTNGATSTIEKSRFMITIQPEPKYTSQYRMMGSWGFLEKSNMLLHKWIPQVIYPSIHHI